MEQNEKDFLNLMKLLTTAESLIIYTALNELSIRVEAESEGQNPKLVADTLKYISLIREKYKVIARTPLVDDKGAVILLKNQDNGGI